MATSPAAPSDVSLLDGVEALIRRMAGALAGHGVDAGDLEQSAWLSLLRALPRFDPARPTSFAAFARPIIRGAILDARRELSGAVRVPKGGPTLARIWQEAERELTAEVGWSPTDGEIARRLGWSAAKARRARRAIAARRSAAHVGTGGPDEYEWGEFDPTDTRADDPAGWAAAVEMITDMMGETTMSFSNGHTNGHASVADLLPAARGDEDEHDAIDERVLAAGTRLVNRGKQASNRAIAAEAGVTTWAVKVSKGRLEAAGRWTFPKYRPEGRTPGKASKASKATTTTDAKGKGRPGKPRPTSPPASPLPIPLPTPRPSASSSTGSTLMREIEAVRVIAQALEGLCSTSVSRVLAFVAPHCGIA